MSHWATAYDVGYVSSVPVFRHAPYVLLIVRIINICLMQTFPRQQTERGITSCQCSAKLQR